jgi:hypothetical protein
MIDGIIDDLNTAADTDTETTQHRRARLILGGLLHSPGSFEAAVRAGLTAEAIGDRTLRDVFRLISRGPIATVAVVRGSNITSAGTDAARRLYAETIPLDPTTLVGLVRNLVIANANDLSTPATTELKGTEP